MKTIARQYMELSISRFRMRYIGELTQESEAALSEALSTLWSCMDEDARSVVERLLGEIPQDVRDGGESIDGWMSSRPCGVVKDLAGLGRADLIDEIMRLRAERSILWIENDGLWSRLDAREDNDRSWKSGDETVEIDLDPEPGQSEP